MSADEGREIIEGHVGILKQCLGLQDHESLPAKLQEKYWEMKRIFDRVGCGTLLRTPDLALLAFLHGAGSKPTAKELAPPTIVDLFRKKKVKLEDTVLVQWKNKEVEAVLKRVTGNDEVWVQIVDDAEERRLPVADVRVSKKQPVAA